MSWKTVSLPVRRALACAGAMMLAASTAHAESWWSNTRAAFAAASESGELHASVFYSPFLDTSNIDLHYAGLHYRHIWDFADRNDAPNPWAFYLGAHVETPFKGPGSYMIGGYLGLRWEKPLSTRDTFYAQGSFGVLGNDIYSDDRVQKTVGSFIEFRERIAVGLRRALGENGAHSIYCELAFEHISNAGLSSRNGGVNGLGLALGVRY